MWKSDYSKIALKYRCQTEGGRNMKIVSKKGDTFYGKAKTKREALCFEEFKYI